MNFKHYLKGAESGDSVKVLDYMPQFENENLITTIKISETSTNSPNYYVYFIKRDTSITTIKLGDEIISTVSEAGPYYQLVFQATTAGIYTITISGGYLDNLLIRGSTSSLATIEAVVNADNLNDTVTELSLGDNILSMLYGIVNNKIYCYYAIESLSIGKYIRNIDPALCSYMISLDLNIPLLQIENSHPQLKTITVDDLNPKYYSQNNYLIDKTNQTIIIGSNQVLAIPDNVTGIGDYAFAACKEITALSIPASITSISSTAFIAVDSSTITVDANNAIYDSRNNCNAIIHTASNTLVKGCTATIVPSDIIKIGDSAFRGSTRYNNGTLIPDYIIKDTNNILSNLPAGLQEIGEYAFKNFDATKKIIELSLPALSKIGDYAFMYTIIGKLTLNASQLVSLGESAFSSKIYKLILNAPALTDSGIIGAPFRNLLGTHDNTPDETDATGLLDIQNTALTKVVPYFFTNSGKDDNYPWSCKLYLPATITRIEDNAFNPNSNLSALKGFGSGADVENDLPPNLEFIGEKAFYACLDIGRLRIPATVKSVGNQAFANTSGKMIISSITFKHTASDELTFGAQVFKVKTSRNMTVNHYGNATVTGYNYSGDNITATLNNLGES